MSALHLQKRLDPSSVSDYAPRRAATADDGRSIRPVLERLRRGEGDDDPVQDAQIVADAPALDPYAAPAMPLPVDPFSIIGRIAVAAGVAGGLGLLAMTLYQPAASGPAPVQKVVAPQPEASALPRKVHTLSFQADKAQPPEQPAGGVTAVDKTRPAAPAAARVDAPTTPPEDVGRAAVTAPLAVWAAVPGNTSADAAPSVVPPDEPPVDEPPAGQQAAAAPAASPPHKAAGRSRHVRHVHHHYVRHHRRHRTRVRQAAAASAQKPADSAEAQSGWTQPSDPFSNALRSVFGHPEAKPEPDPAK